MSKAILALLLVPLLAGGACEKKPKNGGDTGAVNALDRAGQDNGPVDETPLQGIDISGLSGEKQKLFYKLIGSLSSPCGKAHSLRMSFTSDTSCKRAPFAVRWVAAMVKDEATEALAREDYDKKYVSGKPVHLDVAKAPRVGNDGAPIRLVEFFDYQCPHCQATKPELEQVVANQHDNVVEYFMMFPLPSHTDSKNASQAAVAANQMGKFKEMHDILFARSPKHTKDDITGYAKELGLDAGQFETRYNAAFAQVSGDVAQGEAAGVDSTPTIFINDRRYVGPPIAKYLDMWIEEELAVNR